MSTKAMIKFIKLIYITWILTVIILSTLSIVPLPKTFNNLVISFVFALDFIIYPIIGLKFKVPVFDKYYSFKNFTPSFSIFQYICYIFLIVTGVSFFVITIF